MTDRLKIGQEVLIHGYVDEIRKDTIIIQNEGGYFGTVECEVTDIENTNDVLNKIRAEIKRPLEIEKYADTDSAKAQAIALNWCIVIIDKYRKEQE